VKDNSVDQLKHQSQQNEVVSIPTATHCVFRRASSWLALPAMTVREVMLRPEMVFVPGTPSIISGLCCVRSEFIPVLNLDSVISECDQSEEEVVLILDDADGPWALLVDEAKTLTTLEVSDAPDADLFDPACAVVGWATQGNIVIQVIDQSRIRTKAEQQLAGIWQSTDVLHDRHSCRTADSRF
jgi:chemotaxis signal transduction protein